MIVQVALLPERETALDADERFVLGMNELVPHELGLDPELPLAHVAPVILLASVRGHVRQHLLPPAEPFATIRARVRKYIGMQLAVNVQRCLGFISFPARIADIRPFTGMSAPVILPRRLGRKRSAAQVAREILQLRVHVLKMPGQTPGVAELLAAHVAGERSLVLVNPHVSQIGVLQLETPAALGALERLLSGRVPKTLA